MTKVRKRFLKTIGRHDMLNRGDLVICCVSGGPDSMCLLHLFAGLRQELGISVHVAHLNHHMRAEAPQDALMVEDYAKTLGIACTVGHARVFELAKSGGLGFEEAGRLARYRFFQKLKDDIGASKIALGHNRNDQAETVLMRLVRGSGTRGLASIPPVNGDIIRPLLDVEREDIEAYCQENDLPTMSDVYNFDLTYTRNLMRHELIPLLARKFNPSIVGILANTAASLRWDAEYLDFLARSKFLFSSTREGRITSLYERVLETMEPAMASRVLEWAWRECAGGPEKDDFYQGRLQTAHFEALMEGAPAVSLPLGITASREDGHMRFYPAPAAVDILLRIGEQEIPELGITVSLQVLDGDEAARIVSSPEIAARRKRPKSGLLLEPEAYLDYNKCAWPLRVRNRRSGDRFAPLGMKGRERKLQDFFVSNRVPKRYRDFVPLVLSENEIAWVAGLRISEHYKVEKGSKRILRAEVRPYLRHGRGCGTI